MLLRSARALGQRAAAPLGSALRSQSTASAAQAADDAPALEWKDARAFDEMPGPRPLPVVGNVWRFIPKIGQYGRLSFFAMQNQLREEFGDIVRVNKLHFRKDQVWLFDPKHCEKVFRNEGKWPIRDGIKTIEYYRKVMRKEKYGHMGGVLVTQGKEWHDFRSKVNQPMMQPASAKRYVQPINEVSEDFIDRMRDLRDNNKELPADFINELYKWSLESIAVIALDTRLGCLAPDLPADSEPQKMIDAVQVILDGFYKLDLQPSLWRLVSTPMWRRVVRAYDYFDQVADKYIAEAAGREAQQPGREPSIFQRLLKEDPRVANLMAGDMLMAGVDTTSHASASLVFQLATNPDKQAILREELRRALPQSPQQPVTAEVLSQLTYLRACLRESMRIMPITIGNGREIPKDLVIGDYQVPKGTDVFMWNMAMSREERHYPDPMAFQPERWLRGGELAHKAHPFVTLPFGHGPRMCVGRRFAELEIQTLVAKIFRNFRLEYHYGKEVEFSPRTINMITSPLKFRLLEVEE